MPQRKQRNKISPNQIEKIKARYYTMLTKFNTMSKEELEEYLFVVKSNEWHRILLANVSPHSSMQDYDPTVTLAAVLPRNHPFGSWKSERVSLPASCRRT